MNKRQAKKIFRTRRNRLDSPRIAFESAGHVLGNGQIVEPWPWNRQTWEQAANFWYAYKIRQERKRQT